MREFRKLPHLLQRKCRIKIEFCVMLSVLRLFHVYHFVQNGWSILSLDWHQRFSCKGKEWSTAAGSCCRQNLKCENFTSSFGRLRKKITPKACCTCSTIIFLHSTNQIIDLWRCLCHYSRYFLNSLFLASEVSMPLHLYRVVSLLVLIGWTSVYMWACLAGSSTSFSGSLFPGRGRERSWEQDCN